MARIRKKSSVPVYTVAVIWIFWATCMPMYKISHFIWLIIWSFMAYKLTSFIWRGKWVEVAEPEPVYQPTGNQELDELILQGQEVLQQIKTLKAQIKDKRMQEKMTQLETLAGKIFDHVARNPEKASQIRKFMNYYLPTTLKLLHTYAEVSSQGVRGKNITATMSKIETIMDTIVTAFEKQLDNLFGADALDISTDITVLEGMLQREGLAEEQINGAKQIMK